MIQEHLDQLSKELNVRAPKLNEHKLYPFVLNADVEVSVKDLNPGMGLSAKLCQCPQKKREELFIHLMRANLLGQGTGGARLGIEESEKSLTLSLGLPYEMNYQVFRENFEDFVNYLYFWRDEVTKFEREEKIY